jgi:hypothetical protein
MNLRVALENYRAERRRIEGGPHPSLGCSCGICDIVRAADLLYQQVVADQRKRRWRAPVRARRT